MRRTILPSAMLLLLLTAASASFAQEEKATEQKATEQKATEQKATEPEKKATEGIDCSAFRKEKYGYFVTKTTRIATPPLDVTVPKGMPIRRGQKAAEVQGQNLADLIAGHCAG
jgi:hypothetical protein